MKKQIAVLMAAATAVTTVAPVLASADVNTYSASISEVNAKIKAALNDKYKNKTEDGVNLSNSSDVDAYMNSRYAVAIVAKGDSVEATVKNYDVAKVADSGYKADSGKSKEVVDTVLSAANKGNQIAFEAGNIYFVKDAARVQGLIEALTFANGVNFKVVIVDKGSKDGSAIETLKNKHYVVSESDLSADKSKTEVSLNSFAKALANKLKKDDSVGFVKSIKINGDTEVKEEENVNRQVTKIEFSLTSGKNFTLEANDLALDLTKPVDKDNAVISLGNGNAQSVLDQIVGFKNIENEGGEVAKVLLPLGDASVYTSENVNVETIELGKIFTSKDGYSKEGSDFVNALVNAKNGVNGNMFNFRGNHYEFKSVGTGNLEPKIEKASTGWVLKYTVKVDDKTNGYEGVNLQFVIKGDSQKDLKIILDSLNNGNKVVPGYFTRLQGENRYDTAIAISKEAFKDGAADTVVVVGGEALMDGLSAVPLASQKKAPILLANPKSGLSEETLNEIKRAVGDSLYRKNVYVVGGENSVPSVAVKQLEEKLGVTVTRLAGSDRFATSLEVANEIKPAVGSKVFLVGGEGAADAMSVSPVAAQEQAPIVVVPKAGLSKSTRKYLNDTFGGAGSAVLVGGESTISTNVYRGLDKVTNKNRIAGSDRFDTNVLLVKEFYTKKGAPVAGKIEAEGAIFTSGDNKFLVDAQTAGPLAVAKKAPIVLSGAKLTDDQLKLFKKDGVFDGLKSNIFQVGGVVSSDVMSVVVDKLGL